MTGMASSGERPAHAGKGTGGRGRSFEGVTCLTYTLSRSTGVQMVTEIYENPALGKTDRLSSRAQKQGDRTPVLLLLIVDSGLLFLR
jgi:hypothetical protein